MKPRVYYYDRLVKSEDLNHHQTLFAGRCAEWFVEAGFIAVASTLPPNHIVCLKIHGLTFTRPIHPGDIVRFESKILEAGTSSIKVNVSLFLHDVDEPIVSGNITFIHVNDQGRAEPHGLVIE
ncbi:MAG: acyl-CoA thioesterase [Anaerolineales bacterium]